MQISLTSDQINHIKNRYYRNVNEVASNDYNLASTYYEVYKLVGKSGFNKFLTEYFNYDAQKIERAEMLSQARQMFASRRDWMRVGGFDGIKKLMSLENEDKRNEVLNLIRKPKGVVNFTSSDLDSIIKSNGEIPSDNITFFTGLDKPRSKKGQKKDGQIRDQIRKELTRALNNNKTRKTRQSKRRQPAHA